MLDIFLEFLNSGYTFNWIGKIYRHLMTSPSYKFIIHWLHQHYFVPMCWWHGKRLSVSSKGVENLVQINKWNLHICKIICLGNFGGLLGLCLGFSLVNIVEIVYFATVRLYQNISLVYDKPKQNEEFTNQKTKLTEEDKRIRDMYVNDFKNHNQKMFHYRS